MDIKKTWKEQIVAILKHADKPLLFKEVFSYVIYPEHEDEEVVKDRLRFNLSMAVKQEVIFKIKLKPTYCYYILPSWWDGEIDRIKIDYYQKILN